MKATEQHFSASFIMLNNFVLTFDSEHEIFKCDHSINSCWAVLSCGAACYALQGGFNVWRCDLTSKCNLIYLIDLDINFPAMLSSGDDAFEVVLRFKSVDKIQWMQMKPIEL